MTAHTQENVPLEQIKLVETNNPTIPVTLTWSNLEVTLRNTSKKLLKKMSGEISGGFWAVMGPSGGGKSTLLNALARRLDHAVVRTGEVRLNGKKYANRQLKAMSSYVMQEDVLNPYLTLYDTLLYTAKLRMPKGTTQDQILKRVDNIITQMELFNAKYTIVGNSLLKGISGGEKKRLCIGMELLTKPSLLFLDEPTSGLDSITALIICERLKHMALAGKCTIVSTIHQPQTKIFMLFDNLILLKDGFIVYQGNLQGGINFFQKKGFPLPENTNPADHLLDIITPSSSEPDTLIVKYNPSDYSEMNNIGVNLEKGSERIFPQEKD